MKQYQFVYSMPGSAEYDEFIGFPSHIYPEGSHRFIYGNDPVATYLKGCYLLKDGEEPVGRFAIYDNPYLNYRGEKTAAIGSFECINDAVVAQKLIDHASDLAHQMGKTYLIGPMEGSTWENYRFSESFNSRNFFLEPYHHHYYPRLFELCGFDPISKYSSNLDQVINEYGATIDAFEKKNSALGFRLRNLNINDLADELRKIAEFSNDAFRENFLFTPIEVNTFVQKYSAVKRYMDPALIFLIEDQRNTLQAILFCLHDHLDPEGKTLIIKTLARRKDSPVKGVGSYLAAKAYDIADKLYYERIIHAYMIEENASVDVSHSFSGETYKTYLLFGKKLTSKT